MTLHDARIRGFLYYLCVDVGWEINSKLFIRTDPFTRNAINGHKDTVLAVPNGSINKSIVLHVQNKRR